VPLDDLPADLAIWLIRHGETEWSRSGQHTGRTDLPLTPVGEQQARALAGMFAELHPALVLCSPRRRAQDTARLAGLRVDAIDDDLAEWDYGDYEGLTSAQIRQNAPGWTIFRDGAPNGETVGQVAERADRVIARARQQAADGAVVLVSHGHFSRVIGARWIGLDAGGGAHLGLDTAAPSLLGAEHGVPLLKHWNLPNPATS
jgi:broad specificity phosphatase PhoE